MLPAIDLSRAHLLDLSFASTTGGDDPTRFDPDVAAARIARAIGNAPAALGRYLEPRPIYTGPAFDAGSGACAGPRARRLAGSRWRNNQAPLTKAHRNHHIHDPGGIVFGIGFKIHFAIRIKGCEIIKKNLVAGHLRVFKIDGLDLQQRKIAF